jgi:hypothetical protein
MAVLLVLGGWAACGGNDGPALSVRTELTGTWTGSGTFVNNCVNPACRYAGRLVPPSVTLALIHVANKLDGTATLDLPQGQVLISGNSCGPLSGTAEIFDGTVNGNRVELVSYSGGAKQVWQLDATTVGLRGSFLSDVPGCSGLQSDDIVLGKQ